jgi:hypothetical protein
MTVALGTENPISPVACRMNISLLQHRSIYKAPFTLDAAPN